MDDLPDADAALKNIGAQRPFPDALHFDAEKLSRDEGVALWTEFVSNSRVVADSDNTIADFCGDGTGRFLKTARGVGISGFQMAGITFTWEIIKDPGGRFNSPKMQIIPVENFAPLALFDGILRSAMTPLGVPESVSRDSPAILSTPQSRGWPYEFGEAADTVCSA